ncbi:DEAD-box ATP-dependent RNA helicase 50 isoform X2 [Macadamia integrifolia]|uniref:DEAD-box ATP-dependent RNA helicase 50 isoform X2 n=1 Tax=Macadamia integrifolia TaxID=60698 RepID=UPI001C532DC8|nr:DEAD-box ATP-dependent RNA helicase 50 isoform X2 [Macadamia integrifolia]
MLANGIGTPLNFRGNPSQTPHGLCHNFFCSISIGRGSDSGCRCYDSSRHRRNPTCTKQRVCIRAGYTRKAMQTPGAYQLVDDETGEKFIVWGGIGEDSPIPSKEVLSWKPITLSGSYTQENKTDSNGTGESRDKVFTSSVSRSEFLLDNLAPMLSTSSYRTAESGSGEESTACVGGSTGSFGRLKAQRVRLMIRKSSRSKQGNAQDATDKLGPEGSPLNVSDASYSDLEYELVPTRTNPGFRARGGGRYSRACPPRDIKNTGRGTDEIMNTNCSSVVPEQVLRDRRTLSQPHRLDFGGAKPYNSVPRAAAASLRGWNKGEPTTKLPVGSTNLSRKHHKMSVDGGFFSRESFREMGCSDYMIESLRGLNIFRPSHIQAMSFVPVIKRMSCIIADQSGSGKTLAYLAPVVQCLRQEELQGLSKSSPRSPRVVVLVPTSELASQVLQICRSMSKVGVPFRSIVTTGGFSQRTQLEYLQQGLDVLVATPGRFIFLLKEGFLQLANLKCAVLDEVDILFSDEDFEQVLQGLINSAPVTTQYLFVTATLPVDIYNKLVEVFPDCEVIMGPGMHCTSSGLEEVIVDCSGGDGIERSPDTAFLNKKSALLELVEQSPVSKTIIFCNKIETCRKVENVLKRFDRKGHSLRVLPFHAALTQELRLENMEEFLNSQSNDSLFLICTDRDPSEYVRRVGRTARGAGGKGKAFIFVVGKQVSLARRIIERNRKGHPLHDVPSAYELVS